jgi:hypothetical protein
MRKIVDRVRQDGFLLYPIDKSDYARAGQWAFDGLQRHLNLPVADELAIDRAEKRSENVS